MEIGNQIKLLRQRKGVTQEAMAEHFGLTPQAVSKWERDAATPDIALLPEISAYFGVTIDELFAISDDTRMERIQNMLWDDRYYNPEEVASTRNFLLNKGMKEPKNGKVYDLLAQMENHLAEEHQEKAAEYAALQSSALAAARRGYVDDIIDAAETRKRVIASFEMLYTKRVDLPLKKHGTV